MLDEQRIIDRNASPSSYGWAFQVGAGIVLMLKNVKEFNSIRLEGKNEDIEISFDDGKVFAQAKSVTRIGDNTNASSSLKKALESLQDVVNQRLSEVKELIYITNYSNPLNSDVSSAFQYGQSYSFSILPEDGAQRIRENVGGNFPLDKFKLYMLHFYGDDEEKFKSVKETIAEFLRESINDISYSNRILKDWFTQFLVNSTDKPDNQKCLTLSKGDVIWPILVAVTDGAVPESSFANVSDSDNYSEIVAEYRKTIYSKDLDFSFVTEIMYDYKNEKERLSGGTGFKYDFVRNNWNKYSDRFSSISDESIKEDLIKIIMLSIIEKRMTINKLKASANVK